jgi:hypothetical protein
MLEDIHEPVAAASTTAAEIHNAIKGSLDKIENIKHDLWAVQGTGESSTLMGVLDRLDVVQASMSTASAQMMRSADLLDTYAGMMAT